jgi:hypothetical protein
MTQSFIIISSDEIAQDTTLAGESFVVTADHLDLQTIAVETDGLAQVDVCHSNVGVVITRGTPDDSGDNDDMIVVTLYDTGGNLVGRLMTPHGGRG